MSFHHLAARGVLVALLATGCGTSASDGRVANGDSARVPLSSGATIVDDFGDTLRVGSPPSRIVSLNPTTTELVFALGAGARLVGRTHWDLYPDSAKFVLDVGDGIRPDVERLVATKPDLVILYASNDNRAAASALRAAKVLTLSLKIDRVEQFGRGVSLIAQSLGTDSAGRAIVVRVQGTLDSVRRATAGAANKPTVVWPLWEHPLMAAGAGSYLTELVEIAGGRNVFSDLPAPSPQVAFEEVLRRDPDVILVGPKSAARLRTDARWQRLRAVREGHVLGVDTALVERPSVRLGEAAASLARLLHPELTGK